MPEVCDHEDCFAVNVRGFTCENCSRQNVLCEGHLERGVGCLDCGTIANSVYTLSSDRSSPSTLRTEPEPEAPFNVEDWGCVGNRRLENVSLSRDFSRFHVSELKKYYDDHHKMMKNEEWELFCRYVWEVVLLPEMTEAVSGGNGVDIRFDHSFVSKAFGVVWKCDSYGKFCFSPGTSPNQIPSSFDTRMEYAAHFMEWLRDEFVDKGFEVINKSTLTADVVVNNKYVDLSIPTFSITIHPNNIPERPEEDNSNRSPSP